MKYLIMLTALAVLSACEYLVVPEPDQALEIAAREYLAALEDSNGDILAMAPEDAALWRARCNLSREFLRPDIAPSLSTICDAIAELGAGEQT